jgi:hypothetical protein
VKMLLAIRPMQGTPRDVASIFAPPMLLSASAIAMAVLLSHAVPKTRFADPVALAITTTIAGGLYLLQARLLMPQMWRAIWDRAMALLRARAR